MEAEEKVRLNDVLLREEGQVEGGAMSGQDQFAYVKFLAEGRIDSIEIGFPGSSDNQLKQCTEIVNYVKTLPVEKKPMLSGLARATEKDIDDVKKAGCDICHIFIPASDTLMLAQFNKNEYGDTVEGKRRWIIKQAIEMVKYAKGLGFKQIEYSPEDAARTDVGFLCEVIEAVIDAGVDVINIPDTTGLRVGNEFGNLIKEVKKKVSNIDKALISVHCHNDSDHATHNALQAVLAGARQIEGTFFGLGERSGMTKFESIIMNISTRPDIFKNITVSFEPSHCAKIVNSTAMALGMSVPRHWPVVGVQNIICSSGAHQHSEQNAKEAGQESPYYSWDPSKFGLPEVRNVISQSSGKGGLDAKIKEMGYTISEEQLNKIFVKVKNIADLKAGQMLNDEEIAMIVKDCIRTIPFPIIVKDCEAVSRKGALAMARVTVNICGKDIIELAIGDGSIDAIMTAVKKSAGQMYGIINKENIVLDYWEAKSVTTGTDSLAKVYAKIKVNNGENKVFSGIAVDPDTTQASAQAFADCLSWYLASMLVK